MHYNLGKNKPKKDENQWQPEICQYNYMKVKFGFFSYKKSSEGLNNDLKIKLENVKMKGTMHIAQKDWMNSILLTS